MDDQRTYIHDEKGKPLSLEELDRRRLEAQDKKKTDNGNEPDPATDR